MTTPTERAALARRYTCSIIGRPPISASALPGRRVESYRAGMMATTEKVPELTEGPGLETRGTANLTTVDSDSQGQPAAEAASTMTRGVFRSRMLGMNASRVAAWMFGAAVLAPGSRQPQATRGRGIRQDVAAGGCQSNRSSRDRRRGAGRTAAAASRHCSGAAGAAAQSFSFAPRAQPVARPGARRGCERPSPAARRTRRAVAGTDWDSGEEGRGSRRSDGDDIERCRRPSHGYRRTADPGSLRRRGHWPRRRRVEAFHQRRDPAAGLTLASPGTRGGSPPPPAVP